MGDRRSLSAYILSKTTRSVRINDGVSRGANAVEGVAHILFLRPAYEKKQEHFQGGCIFLFSSSTNGVCRHTYEFISMWYKGMRG